MAGSHRASVDQTAQPSPADEWRFLGRRILAVSPWPPLEDGIARYADQLVASLRDREFVRVGLPGGSGDGVYRLWSGARFLKVLPLVRGVDHILVMYHPDYYVQGRALGRLVAHLSLWLVSRRRPTTFVIHEPEHELDPSVGGRGRIAFRLLERVRRRQWAGVAAVVFHSDWERERFARRFPGRDGRSELVVAHGSFFTSPIELVSTAEARERLELPAGRVILLCIGFLSPSKPAKGFERAVEAVGRAGRSDVELHIVGSAIRRPVPEVTAYVESLRELVARTPNVTLHERYVSDEEFDLWIRAADAVVAPYRAASSSGVVARAHLVGTRVIGSGVGGITGQLHPGDVAFSTDDELVNVIRTWG
jgi:glycosyltransferase involved in cell wall biosynthesis